MMQTIKVVDQWLLIADGQNAGQFRSYREAFDHAWMVEMEYDCILPVYYKLVHLGEKKQDEHKRTN